MKFIDRQVELDMLDSFYTSNDAGLLLLYGRRRVGKTQLLSHWLDQRTVPHPFFWTTTDHNSAFQLREFSQELLQFDPRVSVPFGEDFSFRDWDAAFGQLGDIASHWTHPTVFVIDEFTNLPKSDEGVVSVLQRVWDHRLSKVPNLRLVLTGSLIALMESKVIGARAPLFGRATKIYKLRPLRFGHLRELFPQRSPAERVAIYAVCGGIPGYLKAFADTKSFDAGLRSVLSAGSTLRTDASLLLHDQLKDPVVYSGVLQSIASGFHSWNELVKMALVTDNSLGYYLTQLEALDLVERREPVLTSPTGRKGRYFIRDPYLRFYYRFIQEKQNRTDLEREDLVQVVKRIREGLRAFIGAYVFEELCREWAAVTPDLGFRPEEVGTYWSQARGQAVQLDVVAVHPNEKRLFLGEAKWGLDSISRKVLTDLIERSRRLSAVSEPGWKTQYGLFSRAAFTPATRQAAQELDVLLIDLAHLEDQLVASAQRPPALPTIHVEY